MAVLTNAVAEHMASHTSLEKFGSAVGSCSSDLSPEKMLTGWGTPRGGAGGAGGEKSLKKWRMAEHEIDELQEELARKDREVEKLK